jgi:hypothetical protein
MGHDQEMKSKNLWGRRRGWNKTKGVLDISSEIIAKKFLKSKERYSWPSIRVFRPANILTKKETLHVTL